MGALTSLATMGLNMAMAQRAQKREDRQLEQERDRAIRQIKAADAETRRREQDLLKRRLAEERARAGASGTGSSGGSIDAILRGLTAESSAADAARRARSRGRVEDLRSSYGEQRRRSLLDLNQRWLDAGRRALGAAGRRSLLG
ncbi:hypothetical protein SH611_03085 [Geminicoccaceae bacterium 1502E]|nr:hypothetical protein [Geminicoccaceae bacterium 1502E]